MPISGMTEKIVTVDESLESLSDALSRASHDLGDAVPAIDRIRADLASHNTSIPRIVVRDAERVIDHLRQADECLRNVVKDLGDR